jgi:hypothetical protein
MIVFSSVYIVLPSPITHSSTISLAAKSPPNSANIDAAIAAVASNIHAPVSLPPVKSPRKSPHKDSHKGVKSFEPEIVVQPQQQPAAAAKAPKKKPPRKTAHVPIISSTSTALTPVEPSSVPLPAEQDVVISQDVDVGAEVEISENKGEIPRFVLSQDLIGQSKQTK